MRWYKGCKTGTKGTRQVQGYETDMRGLTQVQEV